MNDPITMGCDVPRDDGLSGVFGATFVVQPFHKKYGRAQIRLSLSDGSFSAYVDAEQLEAAVTAARILAEINPEAM